MSSTRIEVAAGLLFRHGRLLIAQRPAGTHLAGCWEFPGGKRRSDEDYPACLRRELREELGIGVAVGDCLLEETHHYGDREIHLRFHRCRLLEGEPRGLEGQALAWVGPDDLQAYRFPPADQRLVEVLRTRPDWWI